MSTTIASLLLYIGVPVALWLLQRIAKRRANGEGWLQRWRKRRDNAN